MATMSPLKQMENSPETLWDNVAEGQGRIDSAAQLLRVVRNALYEPSYPSSVPPMKRVPKPPPKPNPILRPPPLTQEQIAFVLSPGNRKALYENVRRGSFDHVQELRDATHGTKDPAVLKVALEAIRNCRVPERVELLRKLPAAVSRSRFAVCALSVVEDQCRNCSSDPKLVKSIGTLVHEFWDGLSGWFTFFFVTGTRLFMFLELGPITVMKSPIINLMSYMKAFDGSDYDLRFVPGALTLFIQAWDCRDEDGTPIVLAKDGFDDGICPMLTILQRCTENDRSRDELLLEMLVNGKLPLDRLIDTFIARVIKLKELYEDKEVRAYWIVAYLYRINNVTCDIAANQMVQNAFLDAGFIHIYLDVLWDVAKGQNTLEEAGWQLMAQTVSNMIKWVVHVSPAILPNFMDLIKGNLLAISLKCLYVLPDKNKIFRAIISNLELITAYTTHPPILNLLPQVIGDVLEMTRPVQIAGRKNSVAKKVISGLAEAYQQNLQCVNGRWVQTARRRFCDNFEHHNIYGFSKAAFVNYTCSNCHSVLYCSEQCQRQDWVAFHRKECDRAALEHERRKAKESWIGHGQRNYYFSLMEGLASRSRALFRNMADTGDRQHIPIFDTSVTPYDIKTASLADFKEEASYTFREPRMNAFLGEYAQGAENRYLVAGVFFYGKETVHVLARVLYVPDAKEETSEIETDDQEVDTFVFQVIGALVHAEPVRPTALRGQPAWSLNQSYEKLEREIPPRTLREAV